MLKHPLKLDDGCFWKSAVPERERQHVVCVPIARSERNGPTTGRNGLLVLTEFPVDPGEAGLGRDVVRILSEDRQELFLGILRSVQILIGLSQPQARLGVRWSQGHGPFEAAPGAFVVAQLAESLAQVVVVDDLVWLQFDSSAMVRAQAFV